MAETRLIDMKGCGEGEDRLSMLDRFDPPRGEAAPVADPLHLLEIVMPRTGAEAVVVTTPERARDLRRPPAFVLGFGEQ